MFKKMGLGKKIFGGFSVNGALMAILSVVVFINLLGIQKNSAEHIEFTGLSEFSVAKQVDHLKWLNGLNDLFLNDLDEVTVQLDYTKCGLGKFIYGDEGKELSSADSKAAEILEGMVEPHKHLHESAQKINSAWKKGHASANQETDSHVTHKSHKNAAREIYEKETLPALAKTQEKLYALGDHLKEKGDHSQQLLSSGVNTSKWTIVVLSIIAIFVGLFISIFLTRSITKPVNTIIESLTKGAEQTTSASSQLSSSSQQLSEGSSEQASSLEEISSSLEEMASMTKQNADNAKQADTLMGEAKDLVGNGKNAMEQLTSAINEIKGSSDSTAKIIKTIDEIAMQTNLLALNAAVEAARAGEAGRGFAVVAEEVRNLAQRSAEAAKNTAELIEGSQSNSDNGVSLADKASESMEAITESAAKVAGLVAEISAASSEQSQGIDQVNNAVAQMDKVTQNNAANAEESASASEELSGQAQSLNTIVSELVQIVEGYKANGMSGTNRDMSEVYSHVPHSDLSNRSGFGGNGYHEEQRKRLRSAKQTLLPVSGHEVRPEEVIPFEDDDTLKEF